ncbi:MarR family winged helix-turn-helix transcriptional regulator [Pseudonocardia sp. N23]|uniref:MarR family winged helix-turn-helix transcriptional regulator n=1 Tax=Pseudonocardia sp. N23 TaxID=1987376 RepID=UPI000BFB73AE|nr:MarR family transcriptional regulator [Pseudonocardia sp. N23]GAY12864.1 transcriptional regulator, MarR family [Pseudonocardia sp. N23]
MSSRPGHPPMSGAELALRLLAAFRGLVDDLHDELTDRGHADARPLHGFTLQAIGPRGATAVELGERLGVSKQAAGKTVEALVERGYARRDADPGDARRKIVTITPRGYELLALSAEIFERLHERRAAAIGDDMPAFETALRALAPDLGAGLDSPGWFAR